MSKYDKRVFYYLEAKWDIKKSVSARLPALFSCVLFSAFYGWDRKWEITRLTVAKQYVPYVVAS